MSDDAILLRRYADARDEDAFAELVRRHLNLVYSVALRRTGGDAHLAADVAQCVFSALARRAATLPHQTILTGWLYATTRHIAIDVVRAQQRRNAREQEAHAMQQLDSSLSSDAAWEQLRPVLDDAMDDLPARDREAVLLRFYQGRAFGAIGAALGLSEDAARMRIDRALDRLRGRLERQGVTSTAAALGVVLSSQAVMAAPAGLAATVAGASLASVTATAAIAPALTFMEFMITSKIAAGGAALVLALTVGLTVREVNLRRAAETAQSSAHYENAALLVRGHEVNARAAEAERATVALKKSLDDARVARAAEQQRIARANREAAAH